MSHQLPYLVNCSILFTELPLLERPAAAKAAGFDAVEFWWPFDGGSPADTEVDKFVAAVRDAGVDLVGLNFAAGDMPAGDRGLLSWPGRSDELRDSVDVAVGIAEQLGTRAFNALYGNRVDGVSAQEQDELAAMNLAAAASTVERIGATVLIEPVSGAPRYPLLTAADVVAFLDRVGAENTAMLFDAYHLAVNGDDLDAVIDAHHERISHVQVADAPGRGEPGSGSLDLDATLTHLEQRGYSGWVGLEYKPTTSTTDSFAWLPLARRARTAHTSKDRSSS
ncbi:MAG: TIM barrel protein [Mycobacteriaceae bacterium]